MINTPLDNPARPLGCRLTITNPGFSELLADLSASIRENPQFMNASLNDHRLSCHFHPMRFRNFLTVLPDALNARQALLEWCRSL